MQNTFGEQGETFLQAAEFRNQPEKALREVAQMVFVCPAAAWCELMLRQKRSQKRYLYIFDRIIPGDDIGPAHAMEMMYVFHTLHRNWRPFEMKDYVAADRLAAYWCNFARKGDPNGEGLPVWDSWREDSRRAMVIGETAEMKEVPVNAGAEKLTERILQS